MFTIKGKEKHSQKVEEIDEFETRKEALQMLAEYKQAFGDSHCLWVIDSQGNRLYDTLIQIS